MEGTEHIANKIVIVGGVAGGASTAARLRRLNGDAEIILFERGAYISYANCGLPYYVGGEITQQSDLTLQTPQSLSSRFAIVVLAIGVRPESGLARDAGLDINARGGIVVDQHMRTSDEHIYAVGDAVEVINRMAGHKDMIPLAGPANKQGRVAADNLTGVGTSFGGTQGSSILRVFDKTAACTGINEKTAKRLGIAYEKSFTYSGSHAGYYPGAEMMSVKLLFDPDTRAILGTQIVGAQGVDKRCDVIAAIMGMGGAIDDLVRFEHCYAPPYSSAKDPVNMSGFVAENILDGKVKIYHWHDVEEIAGREDALLLDVRTNNEYRRGHISGSLNIPVDCLRQRIRELDTARPVYVLCQIGLRGYIACRILAQKGFTCFSLSGGYRL
ncbi:MAG: FAD-dependent oxidoreductase [Oscillospiraceae bacterium]|nr:FAD-dependent oxidoreductase [Oscillospiraceae bacterium]